MKSSAVFLLVLSLVLLLGDAYGKGITQLDTLTFDKVSHLSKLILLQSYPKYVCFHLSCKKSVEY